MQTLHLDTCEHDIGNDSGLHSRLNSKVLTFPRGSSGTPLGMSCFLTQRVQAASIRSILGPPRQKGNVRVSSFNQLFLPDPARRELPAEYGCYKELP